MVEFGSLWSRPAPPWDPSLVDPTQAPVDTPPSRQSFDGQGGQVRRLSLEEGSKILFPFKQQQQSSLTSLPGEIYLEAEQASVTGYSTGFQQMRLGEGATTYDVLLGTLTLNGPMPGIDAEKRASIQLGGSYSDDSEMKKENTSIELDGGTGTRYNLKLGDVANGWFADSNNPEDFVGAISLTADRVRVHGPLQIAASADDGQGTVPQHFDDWYAGGAYQRVLSPISIWDDEIGSLETGGSYDHSASNPHLHIGTDYMVCRSGTLHLHAEYSDMAGTYALPIELNPEHSGSVRANGYPLVPLRAVQSAAVGTAPSVTADTTGYKFQAGRATVTFTAGVGVLVFPVPFSTGLLCLIATTEHTWFFVSHKPALGSSASVAVLHGATADVGGALGGVGSGSVIVDFIAIGW